jgi:hypothetical protein
MKCMGNVREAESPFQAAVNPHLAASQRSKGQGRGWVGGGFKSATKRVPMPDAPPVRGHRLGQRTVAIREQITVIITVRVPVRWGLQRKRRGGRLLTQCIITWSDDACADAASSMRWL